MGFLFTIMIRYQICWASRYTHCWRFDNPRSVRGYARAFTWGNRILFFVSNDCDTREMNCTLTVINCSSLISRARWYQIEQVYYRNETKLFLSGLNSIASSKTLRLLQNLQRLFHSAFLDLDVLPEMAMALGLMQMQLPSQYRVRMSWVHLQDILKETPVADGITATWGLVARWLTNPCVHNLHHYASGLKANIWGS